MSVSRNAGPPPTGTLLAEPCGGVGHFRWLDVDLDATPPTETPRFLRGVLETVDPAGTLPTESRQPIRFPYDVTRTDAETFVITAKHLQPALYLSKLATRPAVGGQGLGALLVECANHYANARGISRLRWDVWRTNANLQTYYKRLGAQHVRTVEVPNRSSGALFEWAFRVRNIPADVNVDAPSRVLTDVRSTMHHPLDLANE